MPDFTQTNLIPLLYALVLGGAIGLEREWHGRPAGLRTHILVCISSTMLILVSRAFEVAGQEIGEAGRLVFDPNRMGAGIVTGIGFLGAATVLRSGDVLRGLTTAACIWYVAGLGIVLGNEGYALALVGTVIVLIVLTFVNRLTDVIRPLVYRRLIVIYSRPDAEALLAEVRAVLTKENMRILDVSSGHDNSEQKHELVFFLAFKNELQAPRLSERIARIEGVVSARWRLISVPH